MPRLKNRVPSYRLHKASGQALVTLNDQDHYLGTHGSNESRQRYEQLIAEWLGNGKTLSTSSAAFDASVDELILAYWEFAQGYYIKNGRPTGEQANIRDALRPIAELFGETPIREFGPARLKAVRQRMIDQDLCRRVINSRINRIRRVFKWGVENELVPTSVLQGLQAVASLKRGRSPARESAGVRPVPDAYVDAVLSIVSTPVAVMIKLQRLTGMRPGEVVEMRAADLDATGRIWIYTPLSHKTEHHGIDRIIYLGPQAQEVIQPFLKAKTNGYLFSPADADHERRGAQHSGERRHSPVGTDPGRTANRAPGDTLVSGIQV